MRELVLLFHLVAKTWCVPQIDSAPGLEVENRCISKKLTRSRIWKKTKEKGRERGIKVQRPTLYVDNFDAE
jgi:hypothetical protein